MTSASRPSSTRIATTCRATRATSTRPTTLTRTPLDIDARARARSPMTPDYHLLRHAGNRFQQDRESMTVSSYSGLGFDFQAQDKCVTEGPGPIQDRAAEHLGYTDTGIMAGRK